MGQARDSVPLVQLTDFFAKLLCGLYDQLANIALARDTKIVFVRPLDRDHWNDQRSPGSSLMVCSREQSVDRRSPFIIRVRCGLVSRPVQFRSTG